MIVAVAYQHHDYELKIIYVDTDQLDPKNYVDSEFLKAVKKKRETWCVIDASNWEEHPDKFPNDDIGLTKTLNKTPKSFDRAIILQINFDC